MIKAKPETYIMNQWNMQEVSYLSHGIISMRSKLFISPINFAIKLKLASRNARGLNSEENELLSN